MKALVNTMGAIAIGMILASCGNKTAKPEINKDSLQIVLADSVITQLDSIAKIMGDAAGVENFVDKLKKGSLNLTEQQKKAKPDYLLTKSDISDLMTLQDKYVAMGYLAMDQAVAEAYSLDDDDFYKSANEKLATETDIMNEKKSAKARTAPLGYETARDFYIEMKKRNRLDVFFTAETAYCVEALYIVSNNINVFMPSIDDAMAVNISKHVSMALSGMQKLSEGNPKMATMMTTLKPIMNFNTATAGDLQIKIDGMREQLATMRNELIKNDY